MALAVDSTSSGSAADTSCTVSHTVSGTDRLLYACCAVFRGDASTDVISATYNSVAMTEVASGDQSGTGDLLTSKIFRLIAPDTGTHDIVVSTTGSVAIFIVGGVSFTGGHQTTPEGTAVEAEGASSPATVDASSASDEIVIDAVGWSGTSSITAGTGQTEFANLTFLITGGASRETGAGTTTMSWTSTNTNWQIAAIPVKPAAGGATTDVDVSTTATGVSFLTIRAGKVVVSTATGSGKVIRAVSRSLSTAGIGDPAATLTAGKFLGATVTGNPTSSVTRVFLVAVTAIATAVVTVALALTRAVNLVATAVGVPSIVRSVGKIIVSAASVVGAWSILTGKQIVVQAVGAASATADFIAGMVTVAVAAIATGVATVRMQVSKILANSAVGSPSVILTVGKILRTSAVGVATNSVARILTRTVTATATTTARVIKQAGKIVATSAVGSLVANLSATLLPFFAGAPYSGGGGGLGFWRNVRKSRGKTKWGGKK